MRVLPVQQDTIDLLVTAMLISSTDITQAPSLSPIITPGLAPAAVLAGADRVGQQLWDENYASVSEANKRDIPAPRYQWQPVAELLGERIDIEQILQIERSRLYLSEVSCHHTGWDGSEANAQLERLREAIAARLYFHPHEASPEHAGVYEYAGLSRAVDEWTREIGFRSLLSVEGARQTREGRAS
ncbi:hypothetical protein DC31_17225 [Microbacterium sp. CH12i]|uniref:hypothetical protein n=1 Tax=Microbacterium sp. CH12i TaxID=1479651 RepID=UPI000461F820|nr:hypothetical protein [Microbacterium sp. CH12i]KDA05298.1 hypothetical protein DC31_17225 [Microbacterium sp. CH12i]